MTNIPARSAQGAKPAAPKKAPAKAAEAGMSFAGFRAPFIGDKPITTQMQILGAAAAILLALTALLVYLDTTARTRNSTFISIASQMQFHTQRLAKAAGLAARGQPVAFPQVNDSRTQFAEYLNVLRSGGVALGVTLPSAESNPELTARVEEIDKRWPQSANAAAAILAAQKDLVALAQNVSQVRLGAEEMANQSQELTGLMQQAGTPPGQVLRANRITFLSERLGRGAAEILGSEVIDPEVPFLIGKDTNDTRALIQALESGNDAMGMSAIRDPEARAKLADLKKTFTAFEQNAGPILRELQKLVSARQAGAQLIAGSEQLQGSVKSLGDALQEQKSVATLVAVLVAGALLVVVLTLTGLVFLADTRRRAAEAETENRRNQEAILRLLNEMGDLADGDLTIRAQVTEDITGAIADSMNYTIDELRTLVAGVNNAAIQVTQKTAQAQSISAELLGAAEKQSKEIEETTAQVLQVSHSIADVSSTAEAGARVAQRSLAAADTGRAAVQNSISGMNDIREQIQETS
ncbi:MAG: type IV pili methyl-accepting chemotaxis transducer N-terminal domain-containing protein, partial [Usitatibacter sp.]